MLPEVLYDFLPIYLKIISSPYLQRSFYVEQGIFLSLTSYWHALIRFVTVLFSVALKILHGTNFPYWRTSWPSLWYAPSRSHTPSTSRPRSPGLQNSMSNGPEFSLGSILSRADWIIICISLDPGSGAGMGNLQTSHTRQCEMALGVRYKEKGGQASGQVLALSPCPYVLVWD